MGEYGSLIALLVDRCYPRLFRFRRVGRTLSLTTVGPGCPARLWGPQARGLGPGLFPLALLGVTVARVTAAGTAVTAVGALGTGLQGHGRAREAFEFICKSMKLSGLRVAGLGVRLAHGDPGGWKGLILFG